MQELTDNIYKINVDSNVYLLKKEKTIIDTGPRAYHDKVKQELAKFIKPEEIKKIILTHIHYDHCGNVDLFPNADFYTSKKEIEDFKKNPNLAFTLPKEIVEFLKNKLKNINEIRDFLEKNYLEIIEVPGHTAGSIALFHKKEKILFSGDCMFENGIGRYDLPNSKPDEMEKSLDKLKQIKYKILASGHDY